MEELNEKLNKYFAGKVVRKDLTKNEMKEYLKKLRIIPFSSIGKQNGLMLGLKADEVIIQKDC